MVRFSRKTISYTIFSGTLHIFFIFLGDTPKSVYQLNSALECYFITIDFRRSKCGIEAVRS